MRFLQQSLLALLLSAAATTGGAETKPVIVGATYQEPTRRYPHGILGDDIEWGALKLTLAACASCVKTNVTIRLPQHRVFEDTEPRIVDLGQGTEPMVVVVESDADKGARLAVYTAEGFLTGTPFIGRRNRWLAPVGVADLDGDGAVELAYVDRPHLAKILRVWRFRDGALSEVAQMPGLTNHRIGERDIAGGIRDCGGGLEMIVASADWARLNAVQLREGSLVLRDIGAHKGRSSFARAMECS